MTLGERLGTEAFAKYFKAFGYNKKTGIDLPGESGSIISSSMSNLDLAIYAFGQNFNVTPIQQITAVSAVANGGYLVTPHLLDNISDGDKNIILSYQNSVKRQVISASSSSTLREILEEGVSGSGGAKNAYVAGYRIAAKTGTSEKKDQGKEGYYICSCVGFAPADDPKYAVIIIADEPTSGILYGSTVAAPYVADVFENVLDHLGVEPVYSEKELENMAVKVPTLKNWSVSLAENYLDTLGLEIEIIGDGSYVKKQFPEADSFIEKGTGKVIVYTSSDAEEKTSDVPNLVGMTASAANKLLKSLNLNVSATGAKSYISNSDAYVVSQSVSAGTTLSQGSVVTIELKYLDGDDVSPDVD
jgi:stage V sporulation protein D (sporulation-specific penicillin-binding protein)